MNLSSKEGVVFNLPVSQTSLAAFFGVTRPSLARVFKELENEKLIKVRQKEIYILNSIIINQFKIIPDNIP